MKVKIDKMPDKPEECLFAKYYTYPQGFTCILDENSIHCNVETCKYLKVDDDSRNKVVEVKPVDDAADFEMKAEDRIVYVDELPRHSKDCRYSIGRATPFDSDYYACAIDDRHCNDTSKCTHLKLKGPYTPTRYQTDAMRTVDPKLTEDKRLLEGLVGMNSEAGEALDIWKKYKFQGHDLDKEAIALELGDVLWYLTEAAVALGYSLETIMKMNIKKLSQRYPDGFDPEKSKNRKV